MAVTIAAEGSQSATLDTEHTLSTLTTAGVYVLAVDLANMAKADRLVLRIKTKLTAGDTLQLVYETVIENDQHELNLYAPPVPITVEYVATLEQTDGTGRTFIWAIYSL